MTWTMRVLVIDDNPDHRELIIAKVAREYPDASFEQVVRRSDLDRALEKNPPPDLVLTDYRLQWTDGLRVLAFVHERHPKAPVVMVTDTGTEEIAAAGMKAGLSDYVLKGHMNRLPVVVRETMEKARLRREHDETLERLRISEERYRRVSELCSDFAYTSRVGPDGREILEWITEAFQRTTGFTADDFDARGGWGSFVHPEDAPLVATRASELTSGHSCVSEFRILTKSGEERWLRDFARPVDGATGGAKVLGAAQDITERKATEAERARHAELESRELHYRSLAEAMPQIVWTARSDGWVDYFNRAWHDYTGLAFERSQGWGWLAAVHPDDSEQTMDRWIEAVRDGRPHDIQFRLRRVGDQSWRMHLGRAAPIRDDAGGIVKWVGAYTDIEDERRASEALRQAHKVESIGLLAGGIAHDFNNLLTGIMGNTSLAAGELEDGQIDSARELLRESLQASERAADLTRQLLAYSGKGRFFVQPVNVSNVVREIGILLRSSVPRNVSLQLDVDAETPPVLADSAQLQQLVMNLAINAGEAIDEQKGGTVVLRTGLEELKEPLEYSEYGQSALPPGRYVFIEVTDDGCGMEEDVKARIFEPFFSTKFTGRGLGMAAVLGIVRGHNGLITLKTRRLEGTCFRVLFPVHSGEASQRTPASVKIDLRGSGLILVADDEEIVQRVARNALVRYGYDVLLAENGRIALDHYRERRHDIALVLLDMTMPVMSGEETLEAMRQIDPSIPVVATSGHNEVVAIQKFAGRGIDSFLQKPYTGAQLAEKVKMVLAERRAVMRRSTAGREPAT